MSSSKPTNKVIAGVIAGAFVTILVWAAKQFGTVDVPIEVQGALTVIVTAGVQYAVRDAEPPPGDET